MLHIISRSPLELSILDRIDNGDAVLFIDNAVLLLSQQGSMAGTLSRLQNRCRVYVLQEDLVIRGIHPDSLVTGIGEVDYPGFVKLTETNELIQSW